MFREEDALLDDEPIEFKGGKLTLNTDEFNHEKPLFNRKVSSKYAELSTLFNVALQIIGVSR